MFCAAFIENVRRSMNVESCFYIFVFYLVFLFSYQCLVYIIIIEKKNVRTLQIILRSEIPGNNNSLKFASKCIK